MEGTVIRSTGSWYDVQDDRDDPCMQARGRLRLEGIRSTNPVAVGDRVTPVEAGGGMITNIHPRKNCIVRRSVNLSHQATWWRPIWTGHFWW